MSDVNAHAESPRDRVVRSLRTYGNELELYIAAAGRANEMHRTDLAGLAIVMDEDTLGRPVTPGRLSGALQLSAPATTAMLDRLERLGHVHRMPHATDRRSVVVEITDHARQVGGAMFGQMGRHLGPVLASYDDAQLDMVSDFLNRISEATRAARNETAT